MSVTTTTIPAVCEYASAVAARTAPSLADAVAALSHAVTTHNPHLSSMRDDLLRDSRDPVALHNLVRAAEVLGIADAVAICFEKTPHYPSAIYAASRALVLFINAQEWFTRRSEAPAVGDGDDGYRALLFEHLDWVHQYGTLDDGASDNAHTCLSPFTAYLQLILRSTPMEDWAAAAAPSHLSPLGLAWDWARASPAIRNHTVDVVVLVTMGHHVQRAVARAPARAAEMAAGAGFGNTLLDDGLWASLGVVWDRLQKASFPPRTPHSTPIVDPDSAEALQRMAQSLREAGEEYAQLLSETDVDSARVEDIVDRLRTLTAMIVAKAEPLAPPTVLKAIPGLSKTDP